MTSQLDLGTVVLLVLVVGAAVAALVLLATRAGGRGGGADAASLAPESEPVDPTPNRSLPLPAVVVNPTKFGDGGAEMRSIVAAQARQAGWRAPLWLETTVDDPGTGQAREALEAGASVVMACGGDGTVRCVGEVLAGSGVPLGLLPAGTGNLLARGLEMDLDDAAGAVQIALSGNDRSVDVGRIVVDDGPERVFLVMAGMGFDADVMTNAPEELKARMGHAAYAVSGLRQLNGPRTKVGLTVDDGEPATRRVRAVIVGNVGKLTGGLELMPDAELDDGLLDVVSVAPQGIIGWANVAASVLTRHRKGHKTLERWRGATVEVYAESPMEAELDGDPVGPASRLRIRIDHRSLTVRVGPVRDLA